MNRTLRIAALAALGAFTVVGCGGSDAFQKNVPDYQTFALEMDSTDSTPPTDTQTTTGAMTAAVTSTAGTSTDPCHPHLFERSHEVIHRLNGTIARVLTRVSDLAADHPKLQSGTTRTWERVRDGVDRKFTMTKDGSTFTFQLEAAVASATPSFVTVYSGKIVEVAAPSGSSSAPDEITGTMTFDDSALQSVVPTEPSSGQLTFDFDIVRSPVKTKQIVVTFHDFLIAPTDPHGPRNGQSVYFGKPGVGGSLKFEDSLVLLCPSNPSSQIADVDAVAQWYVAADGNVHGRADALAFGGQIPADQLWEGVTCHMGPRVSADSETYWMMKLEDATGATVQGSAHGSTTSDASACDPAFIDGHAQVPSLTDSATDFPFATVFNSDGSLTSTAPYLFPTIQ